jgi:lipopolysaccharide/colanic/teichoic acid biosynthesis glycosyltransferase
MVRLFDILFSSIVILLFLPFGVCLALAIVCTDPGSVFYRQTRIGLNSKPFRLYKFRSMKMKQDVNASLITVGMRDPRITRVGYFIRKFKLDEFPQFLNVLIGDMSVVGPRPEVERYVKFYSSEQLRVLTVRPGITDRASLEYFDENRILGLSNDPEKTYIEEIMPAKLKINLKYIEKISLMENMKIILATLKKVIA